MKKLLALMLSMLMACSMLTACGEKEDEDEKDSSSKTTTTAADDSSKEDDSSSEDDSSKVDDSSKEDDSSNTDTPSDPSTDVIDVEVALGTDAAAPLGETVGDEIELTDAIYSELVEMKNGTSFTIDMVGTTTGGMMDMEVPMVVSTDGTNFYMYTSLLGMNVEVLVADGKTYMLDQTNKVYYASTDEESVDGLAEELNLDELTSFVDKATKANKVTIDGVEFDRIEYVVEETGVTTYAYFNNGKYCYAASISAEYGNSLTVVSEFSAEVDEDLLKVPDGYTEVTEDEYYELVYGDLLGDMEGMEGLE